MAFRRFQEELRAYWDLLQDPAHWGNVEIARGELNRQFGALVPDLEELHVARRMTIAGHEFPIFETAIGPLPDWDSRFIPIGALGMAVTVIGQSIGMLERLEANRARDNARIRDDARVLANGIPDRERSWLWLPISIVVALVLGWFIRGFQPQLWDLFGAMNPQFVRWLIASVVGTIVFVTGNYAINRLASDSEKSKGKILLLLIVAVVSGWITFAIAVPPPSIAEPVTVPTPPPSPR